MYDRSVSEKAANHDYSSPRDRDEAKQEKRRERALRRSQLGIGEAFRPYDLFDRVRVIPDVLLSYPGLTAGEKLTWMTAASFLGKEGECRPSGATLGREMGVDRKQARRWMKGLVVKKFARKISRPPHSDSDEWDTNLYELLWHEVFEAQGGDKLSPRPRDELSQRGEGKSSQPRGDKSPHKKHHHHQKDHFEKDCNEKSENTEKKRPARSSQLESIRGAGTSNESPTTPKASSNHSDDDDERRQRKSLDNPFAEFRARLQERAWLNGAIEPEGIILMVREALSNSSSTGWRFLEYETALTAPEKIRSPGAHYRKLLKDFLAGEPNTRIEEQRRTGRTREDAWQCPDGICKNGIVEDENGLPVKICSCALVQTFSPEKRELLQGQVAAFRVMNGLTIEGAA